MLRSIPVPKWQDVVLTLGNVLFAIGLFPSLVSAEKPAATTSLVTAVVLISFLAVHASYKLWMAFTVTAITAILWFTLYLQAV